MSKPRDKSVPDVLKKVGQFFELLSNVADQTSAAAPAGKRVKAVYGFSIRTAEGKPFFESFGNVKPEADGPRVGDTHEPLVDVFDEGDHLRVVAELPGVEAGDVQVEVAGASLKLRARRGERRYERDVELPCAVRTEPAQSAYRNGIFELDLSKS